jgi:signal transduction histidine kinase
MQLQVSQRLLKINRGLSATLNLQELLQSIAEAAAEMTGCEQSTISQLDPQTNRLRFLAAHFMSKEIMESVRIPLEDSIAGTAFLTQTPVIVQDAQNDERLFRQVDELSGFTTRTLLAVPMLIDHQSTGVLTAVNKSGGAPYDAQDVYVLETLASQAAIAINNAQLMNECRDAYQALAKLDEMKKSFIAITSHELRLPIGLILGHASYLKEILDGEAAEQIRVIERGALRLKDIVEDLSQVENMRTGQTSVRIEAVDLVPVLNNLIERYSRQAAEQQLIISTMFPTPTLILEADAAKLSIAIEHLLKNSLAFTDPGGRIEISVEESEDAVVVHISDTGIGIPEADLGLVFERFYQVETHMTRRHGGMGMGLAVAKMMVELHKGAIHIESQVGKGSRFSILLPKARVRAFVAES